MECLEQRPWFAFDLGLALALVRFGHRLRAWALAQLKLRILLRQRTCTLFCKGRQRFLKSVRSGEIYQPVAQHRSSVVLFGYYIVMRPTYPPRAFRAGDS